MNTFGIQVQTSSTDILPPKPGRTRVGVQNLDPTNEMHVMIGTEDATALNAIRVGPGEFYEVVPGKSFGEPVKGIAISGAVNVVVSHD